MIINLPCPNKEEDLLCEITKKVTKSTDPDFSECFENNNFVTKS